jgi:hypothetical protein
MTERALVSPPQDSMVYTSTTDVAIVVGVNRYPRISDLGGAEADAIAFANWLKSRDGGNVDRDAVTTILSSQFPVPSHPEDAEPLLSTIDRAFGRLISKGRSSGEAIGRRLYIYLAGHGIAEDYEDSSLLTAEATFHDSGFHIPGRAYANWFRAAAFFREVVLIMDCCRGAYPHKLLRQPPWGAVEGQGRSVRHAFAFATKWSQGARERYFEEYGCIRGLFTVALLEGLSGGAPLGTGKSSGITTASLEEYVELRLPILCAKGQYQSAKFDYDANDDVVFTQEARELLGRVIVRGNTWPRTEVLDHQHRAVHGHVFPDGTWTANLRQGLYSAREADGRERVIDFEVIGGGTVDVSFN